MALGEYVSVSSQRDSEHAQMAQKRRELHESPEEAFEELTALYRAKGLSEATARQVAEELTAHDAFGAHLDAGLGIDPHDLADPRQAAAASAVSFTLGALLPLVAVLLPPESWRVPVCVLAVLAALAITGVVSARLGGADPRRAVLRVLVGGALGLALTYGVGHLFGTTIR
jgi:VIT1/CCC1 family predicted Fe2+/Mn2+ transporter